MSQKFLNISIEGLRVLHGDDYLKIVTATRARIQKMNPETVAKAIDRTVQCVFDFVSGTTRVPRASTLSAMLGYIVASEGVIGPTQLERPRIIIRARRDFSKRQRRCARPIRKSKRLRAGKRA